MDCLDGLMSRRSIRRYTTQPVSDSQVDVLLRAAMAAPSAGNAQPWRFVVVTDRHQLEALSAATPYSGMIAEAPLAIVVCADTSVEKHPGYWVQDCSAAVQNTLVAAHAIGLGAVWIGVHPVTERVANVASICSVPQGVEVLAMIAVGHPVEAKPAAERYEPSYVYRDRWQA